VHKRHRQTGGRAGLALYWRLARIYGCWCSRIGNGQDGSASTRPSSPSSCGIASGRSGRCGGNPRKMPGLALMVSSQAAAELVPGKRHHRVGGGRPWLAFLAAHCSLHRARPARRKRRRLESNDHLPLNHAFLVVITVLSAAPVLWHSVRLHHQFHRDVQRLIMTVHARPPPGRCRECLA